MNKAAQANKTFQREVRAEKEKNINNLNTADILWHLVCRHKFILSLTANFCFIVYMIVKDAHSYLGW